MSNIDLSMLTWVLFLLVAPDLLVGEYTSWAHIKSESSTARVISQLRQNKTMFYYTFIVSFHGFRPHTWGC